MFCMWWYHQYSVLAILFISKHFNLLRGTFSKAEGDVGLWTGVEHVVELAVGAQINTV